MRNQWLISLVMLLVVGFGSMSAAVARDTNGDGVETILLPLAFGGFKSDTVPGAFGTLWQGETWMSNAGPLGVYVQDPGVCPVECEFQYDPGFVGRVTEPLWIHPERGVLLQPLATKAAYLTFSARILEVTRHAQPQGFQLPIVREGDFLTRPAYFLGIPATAAVRATLRVYDPRRVAGTAVKVEVLDSHASVIAQTTVTTTFSESSSAEAIVPGFAIIQDVTQFFSLPTSLDRYHIRVTALSATTEYWAMVSVTDNDMQQVLIITPQ